MRFRVGYLLGFHVCFGFIHVRVEVHIVGIRI